MFTDIVGYSALMSKDEKVALQILNKNRELQKVALHKHHGEFIKEIGDGTLSIFQSSWDAVSCAMELQNTLNETAYFQLRIGIHIGDIVISEKDVFGDGVNIASRIQALCEPGGILISETVYHDIRNKAEIKADCLGEKMLKNIDTPVKIYAISAECFKRISEQQTTKETQPQQGKGWLKTMYGVLARKRTLGIATVIILAIIITGGYFIFSKKQRISPSDKERSALKDNRQVWSNSIAVLPFTNLSPEKDQEYFCDGMVEELINVLSHIPELKVVARTSAFSFKGKEVDIRDIGEKLNVKTILEGSVRKSGNQLRISAQLIDVNNGYHLWSQNYDRELKDVFTIQDEISSAIMAALKTKLLPETENLIGKKQTKSTEAYELYLKGRFYWNKRTVDALKKANDYFNQAIGKEPDYALAYAGLALSYTCFPQFGFSSEEFFLKAEAAAEKALTLDSTLADAYAVLGDINCEFRWDWVVAKKQYLKSIDLNPNNPTTHQWYAAFLLYTGKPDQAMAEIQYAYDLDPLSLIINTNLGDFYQYTIHQYDKAIEQYNKTIELDSNFWGPYVGLGLVYEARGKFNEAINMYQKAKSLQSMPSLLRQMGCIYIKTGKQIDGMKILKELLTYSSQGYPVSYDIACLYFCLGEKDKTFKWLETSYENREEGILDLTFEPFWDSLRPDPRFIALLRKMGLEK